MSLYWCTEAECQAAVSVEGSKCGEHEPIAFVLEKFKALQDREVIWLVDDARSHLKEKLKESRLSLLAAERFEMYEDQRRIKERLESIEKRLAAADALHTLLTQAHAEAWAGAFKDFVKAKHSKAKTVEARKR